MSEDGIDPSDLRTINDPFWRELRQLRDYEASVEIVDRVVKKFKLNPPFDFLSLSTAKDSVETMWREWQRHGKRHDVTVWCLAEWEEESDNGHPEVRRFVNHLVISEHVLVIPDRDLAIDHTIQRLINRGLLSVLAATLEKPK